MEWKGCYIRYEKERLCIGNELFERSFRLDASGLYAQSLTDKRGGCVWQGAAGACLCGADAAPRLQTENLPDGDGLRAVLTFERRCGAPAEISLSVRAALPFYTLRLPDAERELLEEIALPKGRHFRVRAVRLFDQTDGRDTLVQEESRLLWTGGQLRMNGTLFFVEDYLNGAALLLLRELPSYRAEQGDFLCADKNRVRLMGRVGTCADDAAQGYDVTVGVGAAAELQTLYKAYYQRQRGESAKRETFCLSNTWGDRNQDGALNEAFVRREIERAADLGIDAVQLDDGWQQGVTANSCLQKNGAWDGGYYQADNDFWRVHPDKFPNGLAPLAAEAARRGVALGLWFSPDSADDFANWERDADTLTALWQAYGIRFFKLDGIRLENQTAEARYRKLLDAVTARTDGAVTFNLDITAGRRTGYFWHKEHGTLFVENRYTDWGNYWPHNTLKNLWQLARFLPAQRLQIEVLNNRRNVEVYGDDPLAPAAYSADYLFAVAMVANPLLWMELSGLAEEEQASLREILAVWRAHRRRFSAAQVCPVGESPDGAALTGFHVICDRPGAGYFLLFREYTDRAEITLPLPGEPDGPAPRATLLCSNCGQDVSLDFSSADGLAHAHIGKKRGYALWQYEAEESGEKTK